MAQSAGTLKGAAKQEAPPVAQTRPEWAAIEADPDFQALVAAKRRFIVPATIFFVVYYFALLILVGYFPNFVDIRVIGNINLAYLFALSEFIMAWVIAWLYVRQANRWDMMAAKLVAKVKGGKS